MPCPRLAALAVAACLLGACASGSVSYYHPLASRSTAAQALPKYSVGGQPAAARTPAPVSGTQDLAREIAELEREESSLWARRAAVQEVRKGCVRLLTALETHRRDPCEESERVCREAFETYREAAVKCRITPCLVALALAGCSSVDAEIRDLNAEEQQLYAQIQELQDQRKRCVGLIVALQQYKQHAGQANHEQVAKARDAYETAKR